MMFLGRFRALTTYSILNFGFDLIKLVSRFTYSTHSVTLIISICQNMRLFASTTHMLRKMSKLKAKYILPLTFELSTFFPA